LSLPTTTKGSLGQKPGEWFKIDASKGNRIGNWDEYENGKLKLDCPGGTADLKWADRPNLNEAGQSKIIKFAIRVTPEKGCDCTQLDPVYFTFRIVNFDNDPIRPKWDNMGKEILAGIDDNEEPKSCTKETIKWSADPK
jgi:hypothetical protein